MTIGGPGPGQENDHRDRDGDHDKTGRDAWMTVMRRGDSNDAQDDLSTPPYCCKLLHGELQVVNDEQEPNNGPSTCATVSNCLQGGKWVLMDDQNDRGQATSRVAIRTVTTTWHNMYYCGPMPLTPPPSHPL
jgi:hypothetical protein